MKYTTKWPDIDDFIGLYELFEILILSTSNTHVWNSLITAYIEEAHKTKNAQTVHLFNGKGGGWKIKTWVNIFRFKVHVPV